MAKVHLSTIRVSDTVTDGKTPTATLRFISSGNKLDNAAGNEMGQVLRALYLDPALHLGDSQCAVAVTYKGATLDVVNFTVHATAARARMQTGKDLSDDLTKSTDAIEVTNVNWGNAMMAGFGN